MNTYHADGHSFYEVGREGSENWIAVLCDEKDGSKAERQEAIFTKLTFGLKWPLRAQDAMESNMSRFWSCVA